MTQIKVVACSGATVLEDGSLMEIELEGHDKQRIALQFDEETLDQVLGRSIQLSADARNKKHAKAGLPGIPALPAAAAGAGPNANGSHVILVLKIHTGTEFHFALPTHGAEQLAKHIMAAVAAARQLMAQARP